MNISELEDIKEIKESIKRIEYIMNYIFEMILKEQEDIKKWEEKNEYN